MWQSIDKAVESGNWEHGHWCQSRLNTIYEVYTSGQVNLSSSHFPYLWSQNNKRVELLQRVKWDHTCKCLTHKHSIDVSYHHLYYLVLDSLVMLWYIESKPFTFLSHSNHILRNWGNNTDGVTDPFSPGEMEPGKASVFLSLTPIGPPFDRETVRLFWILSN